MLGFAGKRKEKYVCSHTARIQTGGSQTAAAAAAHAHSLGKG